MSNTIARITDIVADLNGVLNDISDNETIEFDVDDRLTTIEATVETLSNEVEETIEFSRETSV
ncbi:MAG: hypothetical protein O7D34_05220 [Ignavibacteria bacterium]|nr:hypothetical protein [Ignavibacteria bacterium]